MGSSWYLLKISLYLAVFCGEFLDSWELLVLHPTSSWLDSVKNWNRFNHHSKKFRNADGSFFSILKSTNIFFLGGGRGWDMCLSYDELYTRCFFCRFVVVTYMRKIQFLTYVFVSTRIESTKYGQKMQWDQHYSFFFVGELFATGFCVYIYIYR